MVGTFLAASGSCGRSRLDSTEGTRRVQHSLLTSAADCRLTSAADASREPGQDRLIERDGERDGERGRERQREREREEERDRASEREIKRGREGHRGAPHLVVSCVRSLGSHDKTRSTTLTLNPQP